MPRASKIAEDRIPPSKQPNKRRLQAEAPESSNPSSSTTRTRVGKFVTVGGQGGLSVPQRQSDEHLRDRSRKKARTGPQQPREKSAGSRKKGETRPQTARSQSAKSKSSSPRLSRPIDRRSATLSAEPPLTARSTIRPSNEQDPSRDPDFELKRCAREQFRETGDFSVFYTLLAPFRKGEKKRELSDWAYDKEKQRWRREDRSSGSTIWAPTFDSFL